MYRAFSEYALQFLFKEILLLILSLISMASRTTCFMPRSLLIMADPSKSISWLGFSKTWLLKAESKEKEAILEFRAIFFYIFVLLRTTLGHRAEILILISFPCLEKFPIDLLVFGVCDGKVVWSSSQFTAKIYSS